MALWLCRSIFWSFSGTSRTSFLLFLPSLLLLTITAVHADLPCPPSCSCPRVKEVYCTFRHLTTVPKTLPKDTERLNLGYNSLTEVEGSEFRSLRQLEMLMLHGNDINTLHAGAFYSLTSLQILKLSYNKLTSVSIGLFEGLVGLVRLHLDHNLITFIEPYSFSGLPSLKLLQLEGNLLKEIHPHTFITVSLLGSFWTSGLKHLHLSDNLLEFLPAPALRTAPRLELLSLHGNPWSCDCQLQWLLEWSSAHEGVIKCKKERESGSTETCPHCLSPQSLNGTSLLELNPDKVSCERPILTSSLKQFDNPIWAESSGELDHPYVKDLEKPLGHLTFMLSDSHANSAHVACDVRRPGDSSPMTWSVMPHSHGEIRVNVSLATALECEIDRETLQSLWQLVAYYYESPAILERGQQKGNNSRVTYQYAQVINENSPYFTDLKGYLVAEPSWLLQRRVSLRLNRKETTTKKLVMDFTTTITKDINIHRNEEDNDLSSSWALIHRGTAGRVQTVVEGSKAHLECNVFASDPQIQVEWMLPDFSIVETGSSKVDISESGKLVIMNASRSDSGLYYCMTKTKAGVDLMPLRLTVKERVLSPTAFNGQRLTIAKGDSFSLPCQVTSVNPSQTLWYLPKNNVLLPTQQTRRAEVMENGTLVVKKFTVEEAGEYSCLASNLYGVDMLSHVVELEKLKLSSKSKVKTEKELWFSTVDLEGSGTEYQEITRPNATQFPKTGPQQNSPNRSTKKTQIKDTKITHTNSVKELLPRQREQISTHPKNMPIVIPTQEDPSTATANVVEFPSQTSSTMASFTRHRGFLTTTPVLTVKPWGHAKVETGLTEKRWNEYDETESAQTQSNHLQTSVRTTKVPFYHFQETDTVSSSFITRPKPTERPSNQQRGEGRRRVASGSSNRRRPHNRQRVPPLRRVHPARNNFRHRANMLPTREPTTLTPPTTLPPTTTTTTTTTTLLIIDTTTDYSTKDEEYYEESEYNDHDDNVNENKESEETPDITNVSTAPISPPARGNVPPVDPGKFEPSDTKIEAITPPTELTLTGKEDVPSKTVKDEKGEGRMPTKVRGSEDKNNAGKQEAELSEKERFIGKPHNHNFPNLSKGTSTETHTPVKVTTSESAGSTPTEGATDDIHHIAIMEPLHPWLHPQNQGRGQPTRLPPRTHQDRSKIKQEVVHSNWQPLLPRVPPTTQWHVNRHHQHNPHIRHPHWPSMVPTYKPWHFAHPWAHSPVVTNRPEIIAETMKPSPTRPGWTANRPYTPSPSQQSHHDRHGDFMSQTRDQRLFSRLRNRYRQAQIDRISQLGRIVTPRPIGSRNDPPIFDTPTFKFDASRQAFPTRQPASTPPHTYIKPLHPVKSSSAYYSFNTTPQPHHSGTQSPHYGSQWPVGAGRIVSRRPTAVPPYPFVLGSGGNGVKPHITTLTPASVSVLAEGDVVLDCKATGIPEPTIAWTKVSTGATIPANSRHGGRFEVLKNGTFLIKTVQLQDRGQYLCTAQNRFGSDRMVMTLAVQTEPPKIQHPKSFNVAIYVGKGVALDCLASGRPLAQISWILPDRMFVRDFGTVHSQLSPMSLLENGTLQIHSANFSSKGDYKCIASNAAGADTVTYHLHVAALPPSISEEALDSVLVSPGKSVYVHCSVKGEPVPSLKWTLPTGAHVKPSQFLGRKVFVYTNGTLYLKNISPSDAGSYECSASNTVGTAKRTVQLRLQSETPALARRPPAPFPIPSTHRRNGASRMHSVTAMHGSAVYLHCPESSGRATWQLPSKAIMDHRHSAESQIKVFRNGTLRILQLTEHDGGAYLCISQRPNGENIEHFQVQVLMTAPRIEHVRTAQAKVTYGENFQVDCVATGLPDPEVSWSLPDGTLINNALQSDDSGQRSRRYVIFGNGTLFLQHIGKSDEGDYTCYAQNKVGKDERKVSVKIEPNRPKIRFKSQSLVKVKFGEAAKLTCQATGEPPPKIIWISPKSNVIQMNSEKFWIMEDGALVIKRVKLADEGKYTCVARNSAGDDVKNTMLEIDSQEPLIKGISGRSTTKVLVISYQSALLDCKVDGKPEPRVWWVTPLGHSLPAPYLGGRFQVHQNKSLELRGVRKADEGKYICLAKNGLGDASLLVELEVASHAEKPIFTVPNIEIIPIKQDGREMILDCRARGKPDPDFAWVLPNGTMLLPGSKLQRFIHVLGNGSLKISQPEFNDKGVYRCLAKNVAGQAEKRYSLEAGRKPLIRGSSGQIKMSYGQNFDLHCSADGWPQPSIKWTLPNGLVLDKAQTVGRASVLANGTLQLRQVAMFDKGTYTCKAFNSFGSSTMLYSVTVTVFPPRITSILAPITRVHRGSPVVLHCLASGTPRPDISWTLPGRTTLVPHNRFTVQGGIHMTEEGSLVLQNPVLTNSGIYKCNAKNALGTDFKSTYLQVV
ncbi:matrix-remodeling-associated protein 5 [Synchiropus picturatus]